MKTTVVKAKNAQGVETTTVNIAVDVADIWGMLDGLAGIQRSGLKKDTPEGQSNRYTALNALLQTEIELAKQGIVRPKK